jgi:hypothetical protein
VTWTDPQHNGGPGLAGLPRRRRPQTRPSSCLSDPAVYAGTHILCREVANPPVNDAKAGPPNSVAHDSNI